MKINAIGVDAYRQMSDRSQPVRNPDLTDQNELTPKATKKVSIPAHDISRGSKVSIKLQGRNLADTLSVEEKQALELLFEKFSDKKLIDKNSHAYVGNLVDVKL